MSPIERQPPAVLRGGLLASVASVQCLVTTNKSPRCFASVLGRTRLPQLGAAQQPVVAESTEANLSTHTWQHTNVFAGGRLLATCASVSLGGPQFSIPLTDWLGTKRAEVGLINGAGCSTFFQELAYGDGLTIIGGANPCNDATEHHFTGKERDSESGNDYFAARYYNSATGRFFSPDWSAKVQPVPYAKLDDPQSLNLYSYVRNNPLSRVDADGHCDKTDKATANTKCQ